MEKAKDQSCNEDQADKYKVLPPSEIQITRFIYMSSLCSLYSIVSSPLNLIGKAEDDNQSRCVPQMKES